MARPAGDGGEYHFVLRNLSTGKYEPEKRIELVSVTTVIKAVLAKPLLVDWAARVTREGIAAWIDGLKGHDLSGSNDGYGVLDILSDPEWTQEILKDNKLRWQDIRDDAGDRGRAEHKTLEELAGLVPHDALVYAEKLAEIGSGYGRATAGYWLEHQPKVLYAEETCWSLRHGFAGQVDLVTDTHVIDLKSREKYGPYQSDFIQVGGYRLALEEMGLILPGLKDAVLVIHPTGKYQFEESTIDGGQIFLNLLSTYNLLKSKGGE